MWREVIGRGPSATESSIIDFMIVSRVVEITKPVRTPVSQITDREA